MWLFGTNLTNHLRLESADSSQRELRDALEKAQSECAIEVQMYGRTVRTEKYAHSASISPPMTIQDALFGLPRTVPHTVIKPPVEKDIEDDEPFWMDEEGP